MPQNEVKKKVTNSNKISPNFLIEMNKVWRNDITRFRENSSHKIINPPPAIQTEIHRFGDI